MTYMKERFIERETSPPYSSFIYVLTAMRERKRKSERGDRKKRKRGHGFM